MRTMCKRGSRIINKPYFTGGHWDFSSLGSSLSCGRVTQEKITDSHFGSFWVFKEYPIKIPNLAK